MSLIIHIKKKDKLYLMSILRYGKSSSSRQTPYKTNQIKVKIFMLHTNLKKTKRCFDLLYINISRINIFCYQTLVQIIYSQVLNYCFYNLFLKQINKTLLIL